MAQVRMTDPVSLDGATTTIAALDAEGRIEFRFCDCFFSGSRAKGYRAAYFADIKGTRSGWEIGKKAYESRTGHLGTAPAPDYLDQCRNARA